MRNFKRTYIGDGIYMVFDYGAVYFEDGSGRDMESCPDCGKLVLLTELDDHDGLCKECRDYNEATKLICCPECGQEVEQEELTDNKGICTDCLVEKAQRNLERDG